MLRIRNAELLLVLASQFDKEPKQCRPEIPCQPRGLPLPNRCRMISDRLNPPTPLRSRDEIAALIGWCSSSDVSSRVAVFPDSAIQPSLVGHGRRLEIVRRLRQSGNGHSLGSWCSPSADSRGTPLPPSKAANAVVEESKRNAKTTPNAIEIFPKASKGRAEKYLGSAYQVFGLASLPLLL